jgi:hypothetical protein
MHGPSECDGNVQQLCVREHTSTIKEWWNFIQCSNYGKLDKVGDISLAKQCSKIIGKDWDRDFSDCYTGSEGRKLLQKSGKCHSIRSVGGSRLKVDDGCRTVKLAMDMDIKKSCSILVNDKLVCVHDGSWKDCPDGHQASDFERIIRKEYDALNSAA